MAHFAKVDANNTVIEVLVIDQANIDTGNWGDPASFWQTSYNTRGGVYYTPNTKKPDPDQSKAFRKNFAGVGYTLLIDGPDGIGFVPPKPTEYPSWVLNSFSYRWEPPIPKPIPNNPPYYKWDEATISWVLVNPQSTPPAR